MNTWKREASVVGLAILAAICSCAPVQHHETLRQPFGLRLSADIGSPIFHVERTKDLPNAFGNADLYGGKVDEGYVVLLFAGLAPSGEVRFHIVEMNTRSNETTMSRYGGTQVHATTNTYGNTSYTDATIREPQGRTQVLPPNTTEFLFDPRSGPLTIRGIEVTIVGVWPYRCDYVLRDLRRTPPR